MNQLINFVYSTNVTLVHHASRTLAQLCSVPHLARSVLREAVFETILKLIQVSDKDYPKHSSKGRISVSFVTK